jgi:hypothetical protein
VTEVDPDPFEPGEGKAELGGHQVPAAGDPTEGGKRGQIGESESIAADEPDDGNTYPVGGGTVTEERNAPPVADPGADA